MINSKMLFLLINNITAEKKMNIVLQEVIAQGFIELDGCYFLRALFQQQAHINANDFIDKIAYECFINSIHVDDYLEDDLLVQSFLFLKNVARNWSELNNGLNLKIILSETDFGFNIKFHLDRIGTQWIDERELNKFEEAILIVNSKES